MKNLLFQNIFLLQKRKIFFAFNPPKVLYLNPSLGSIISKFQSGILGNVQCSGQLAGRGKHPFLTIKGPSACSQAENVWDPIYKCINTCHSFALTGTVESQPEKEVPATRSEISTAFPLAWDHFVLYFHRSLIILVNETTSQSPNQEKKTWKGFINISVSATDIHFSSFIPPKPLAPRRRDTGGQGRNPSWSVLDAAATKKHLMVSAFPSEVFLRMRPTGEQHATSSSLGTSLMVPMRSQAWMAAVKGGPTPHLFLLQESIQGRKKRELIIQKFSWQAIFKHRKQS